MKHIETIEILIQTLVQSQVFHALIIESPPGWSKSTTIDATLKRLSIPFLALGSYTTSLHFYNTLAENPDAMIVLDDCAGLYSDIKTMAILKGATWSSSGEATVSPQSRRISWGSTSEKVVSPFVDFSGKLILLTNALPNGKEVQAFLSRCLSYRIAFTEDHVKSMIVSAARSPNYFSNPDLARAVAEFIAFQGSSVDFSHINLRTLRLGYELASTQPDIWRQILPHLLPKKAPGATRQVSTDLINPVLPPKIQEMDFCSKTGKSRRTFYNYKKKLGLTRGYRSKTMG